MNFRNRHLIHAINQGFWHMRSESAIGYLPMVVSFLTDTKAYVNDTTSDNTQQEASQRRFIAGYALQATPYVEDYYYDYPPFRMGNVVVIPIREAIDSEDYCGIAGTNTIKAWYDMAAQDNSIVGVVELVNSGGGSVFGTSELASYKTTYPKPIITLSDGLCCSAAYYIACSSKQVWATSKSVIVGSVGTMTSFRSFKKYYADKGIDMRDIYSSASPLKNDAHRQAQEGNDSAYQDGILFSLDTHFMDFVQSQRPNITQNVLDGADMTADKALTEGLIDQIGTLEQAVAEVQKLAKTKQPSNNMSKTATIKTSNALVIAMAKLASASIEEDEETEVVENETAQASVEEPTPTQPEEEVSAQIQQAVSEAVKPLQQTVKDLQEKLHVLTTNKTEAPVPEGSITEDYFAKKYTKVR